MPVPFLILGCHHRRNGGFSTAFWWYSAAYLMQHSGEIAVRSLARFITLLMIIPLLIRAGASMQAASGDLILFEWNDTLYAQGIDSRPLITVQQHRDHAVLPLDGYASPPHGYGFYQGMWNADQTRFAYTLIREGGAAYQVGMLDDGAALTLIADELSAERGYLVPVGWAEDGRLILLERFMLHNLAEVRLWQFAPADQSLTLRQVIPIPFLSGNSAVLANGRVFLGFNTARSTGYLLDWSTGQVTVFPTGFSLQDPPASVFETYPVRVIGVVDAAALQTWITEPNHQAVNVRGHPRSCIGCCPIMRAASPVIPTRNGHTSALTLNAQA